jgi:hypothetical protein
VKAGWGILFITALLLAGCATSTLAPTPTAAPPTASLPSSTPRNLMLPTWTPSPTPLRKPTPTPNPTLARLVTPANPEATTSSSNPPLPLIEILVDRPTGSQLPKPENLASLEYDPRAWQLNSFYPTVSMGYSLSSRPIYGCKLEPILSSQAEGYEVEQYRHTFGSTSFQVSRLSQAGVLAYADYCTGDGEDATCYRVTPGDDHEACIAAAEGVLESYALLPNLFFGNVDSAPNRWICQDAAGTTGLCLISYSVPLNALAFTSSGQAWAVGDDGIIFERLSQAWQQVDSPALHPLYGLDFSNPSDGWAVGDGAQVLHWDGSRWAETLPYHAPGEGPGASTQVLYAVAARTRDDVWMLGSQKGIDNQNSPYVLHWDGQDLLEETGLPECNCGLKDVLVTGKDDVFAAGGSDLGAIILHWDGSEWSSSVLPGADLIYSLDQSVDGTLWAAGIEVARDLTDTRGALFRWDGTQWQRVATPPLTGGVYTIRALPDGRLVLGGDFTALRKGLEWQPIRTDIAGYQWIMDIEQDPQGNVWALTRSGNIFELGR